MKTPNKEANSSVTSITPVRLLSSPKTNEDEKSSSFICKKRLDVIVKNLEDNYAKWQLAQKRGLSLCISIEALKTRSLESASRITDGTEPESLYPKELKSYCDKLFVITKIFSDIIADESKTLKQLRALNRMNGVEELIFFRTWKLQQFIDFTEHILACYEKEVAVKEYVMSRLAHCMNRADLIRCTTAWEYPQYVDGNISLCFAFLHQEMSIDKR